MTREENDQEQHGQAVCDGVTCPVHHTQLRWGQCAECGPDEDSA